ncbi:MAG TPA: ABC transporter ATP-binding protein [Thermoanaerobaculia bacterium]|nr:ABC transporter ATP-binding protein [Thermoanaerobaculia bacterium]
MDERSGPHLKVTGLEAGYGGKRVLNGISLAVAPGEIVALIGHNGAGKSTVLKAIFGLVAVRAGEVSWDGEPVASRRPRELLDRGISYLPQGNRVFPDLTVEENLRVGATLIRSRVLVQEALDKAFAQFPALRSRRRQKAATLSGGEKQMLALANAMMRSPRLLLLDEPSLGLAPALVTAALGRIRDVSAGMGMTVLIVEQKVREVLKIAHRVYVLRAGHVSFSGPAADLRDEQALRRAYL